MRLFKTLITTLLLTTGLSASAQYLNITGNVNGEQNSTYHIDISKVKDISFPKTSDGKFNMHLKFKDDTEWDVQDVSQVGDMTNTEEIVTTTPQVMYCWYDPNKPIKMLPVYGHDGLYHYLFWLSDESYIYYSDKLPSEGGAETAKKIANPYFVGWNSMYLNTVENYANISTWRTSGFGVYLNGKNSRVKMSIPLKGNAYWASPTFTEDDEVWGYNTVAAGSEVVNGGMATAFTAKDGKIRWIDSNDLPSIESQLNNGQGIKVPAGKKVYINFETGDVLVSTPDEVPFGLESPLFIQNNDGSGTGIKNLNTAYLKWNAIDGASGYRIKVALASKVSGGGDLWDDPNNLISDQTVGANQQELTIAGLNYYTDYQFAIQALSPRGEAYHSDWYGVGDLRNWYAYCRLVTNARYAVPTVLKVSYNSLTKTGMRVNINRTVNSNTYTDAEIETFKEHFNFIDDNKTQLRVDYLTITPTESNPNATVPEKYKKYQLSEEELAQGYIEVDGLSENSLYHIQAWDQTITPSIDACYNSVMVRTKGTPGPPIPINHVATLEDTQSNITGDISAWESMKLDDILNEYANNNDLAEGQEYYLEGGKAYHISNYVSITKGITLRTNPADLAQGKRAKLYLGGLLKEGNNASSTNFMIGRSPIAGEDPTIVAHIEAIRFLDLDIDCPLAQNYGNQIEGTGSSTGNYFMNMFSNGLSVDIDLIEWNNCTFQGMIRGFMRIQGSYDFNIRQLKMIDCEHYNSGYYDNAGRGYSYIYADHGSKPKSNVLENVEISGCVFYDSPRGNLITDHNRDLTWDESVRWNINIHHNTFVNFCTRANTAILNTRYIPGGSVLAFHDNVIINTKDEADENRTMYCAGWDARNIQGGDGSGACTFDIYNNWTTNDNLTNDQPFTANAFNASSNSPYKSAWRTTCTYPHGTNELVVHKDNLKATELMASPNPQHHIGATASHLDHHTDTGIDGLYYQQTSTVLNSDIYKSGAGAPKLRNGK
ncbi:MAG: hypothetical protein IJV17_04705 [Prevotella sp.]|nr:hypothetical protein [Prevotella sp.]